MKPIDPKRLQSAAEQAVRQRNYRRARDRALVRLANDYPEEYRDYLKEEQARDDKEGRRWLDLAGNTIGRNLDGLEPSTDSLSDNLPQGLNDKSED